MIFDIALTIFLVCLNGIFVAAEFSIVKVRLSQIELKIRAGSSLAGIAKHLKTHLDSFLSATQLGITIASLGLGWIGQSVVASIILNLIHFIGLELEPESAKNLALPAAFITITILHIVFGELVPKNIAIHKPDKFSVALALPLRIFYFVLMPFIWLLELLANTVIKLLGFEPLREEQELHSSDEIRYLLEESSKSGMIDITEHKMLENVFDFSDTDIKQIMVPRNRIVGFEVSMKTDEIMEKFIEEGYSRMPVYSKSLDNIIGVVYAKDIITMLSNKALFVIQDIIRTAYFVSEDEKINKLLRDLQKRKMHLAVVLDEFGGTAGIVTMEDILEEIVGEIQDEYDEETPPVEKINDNEFIVKALTGINDLNDYLTEPLPESEDYETVGGLITNFVGRIPEANEIIEIDGYNIKIIKRSKRSIELVKLSVREKENQ